MRGDMKAIKKITAVIVSALLLAGFLCTAVTADANGDGYAGSVLFTADGNTVTAEAVVSAKNKERTLYICSYGEGRLIEMAADKKVVSGEETLSASIKNTCDKITAYVVDENGQMLIPEAVYGTDSTDLDYIEVNGKKLEEFDNAKDKYDLSAASLEVRPVPCDGTTKTETEYKTEPTQAVITVTSARGRKRVITVSAYKNEQEKTELVGLSYKYGDTVLEIDKDTLATREFQIDLPKNVMSVSLEPRAIGDVNIFVEDTPVTDLDGVHLGQYGDICNAAYPYQRYAVNNTIPIKNEIGKAIIKVSYGTLTNDYIITFVSRQPRLLELNYTGAEKDTNKPTFIGGSAVNNDNGTLNSPDRGWALTNVSKALSGGSCFMIQGQNEKDTKSWWQTSGRTGEYFNFKTEYPCTVYVLSANKLDSNTAQWNDAGWTKVNNGDFPKEGNLEYGDNSSDAKRGDKTWNGYEDPEYFAGLLQYNSASSKEIRCIDPGVKKTEALNSMVFRCYRYIYKNSFDAEEKISIYHTGRTDTLGCFMFIIVKWDETELFYAPEEETEDEDLLPELPALEGGSGEPEGHSISIRKNVASEQNSIILLNKKEDGTNYTLEDLDAAVSANDADAVNNIVLYCSSAKAENGKIDTEIYVPDEKGVYTLAINGKAELVSFISEAEKAEIIEYVIENKAVKEEDMQYISDSMKLNMLKNIPAAASIANGLIKDETELDAEKIEKLTNLAVIIESLNEKANGISFEDIERYTDGTAVPLSAADNIKDISSVTAALSGKNFKSAKAFKNSLSELLFLKVMNNKTSQDMTAKEKKAFFEEYAEEIGLDLDDYNKSGVDRQAVIVQLATKGIDSVRSMQTELDRLSVVPEKKTSSSGGSGGSGGGSGTVYQNKYVPVEEVTPVTPEQKSEIFSDMDAYEWAKNAVYALSEQGIINGYGDSTFRPQNNITRAEFVTIIVNAFLTGEPSGEAVFTDVYEDAWYFSAVMLAFEKGIIKGVSETEFMPEENIRRQDMAVILKNLSVLMGKELPADDAGFSDDDAISDYAKEAVSCLKGAGVIKGNENKMFEPLNFATRAEAAQMISTFISTFGREGLR